MTGDQPGQGEDEEVLQKSVSPTKDLPWSGILNDKQLEKLKEKFGDVILIPGRLMRLIGFDVDGVVKIPGSSSGYKESTKIFKTWKRKAQQERKDFDWWPALLQERKMQLIHIRDVLNGLQVSQWKKYQRVFSNALSNQRSKKSRQIKQRQARVEFAKENKAKISQAADALISLQHDV